MRLDNLRKNTTQYDAVLVTNNSNRFYLSKVQTSAGVILVTKDDAFYICDFRYYEILSKGSDITPVLAEKTIFETAAELCKREKIKILGLESSITYENFLKMSNLLPKVKLLPIGDEITSLREVKSEEEIENITTGQRIAEKCFDNLLNYIKPGVTEKSLVAELIYLAGSEGAVRMSFDTILVSSKNTSQPHGRPSDNKIKAGEFVLIDFGVVYNGYCSDMTRTLGVTSVSDEMRKVYDIVKKAQENALLNMKAGMTGREIDSLARDIIVNAGYGDCFGHSLGHSVGIDIHELPNLSGSNEKPIKSGCVVTVEPGIYLEGKFGVRIEDMVVVTDNGCHNITKTPKDLIIL